MLDDREYSCADPQRHCEVGEQEVRVNVVDVVIDGIKKTPEEEEESED